MNKFIELYGELKTMRIKCQPFEKWMKIKKYVSGSGGSNSIIILGKYKKSDIVIKLSPRFIKLNNEKSPRNNDIVEIVIYKYFTKKYILNNKTPHIVGLYAHTSCPKLDLIFKDHKCPTIKDILLKKNVKLGEVCQFKKYIVNSPIIDQKFDMSVLEFCSLTVHGELEELIKMFQNGDIGFDSIECFIFRVNFQIIYTLACIHKNEKNFTHNDLFLRNILGVREKGYNCNDYIEYKIFGKSFYLPANGFYAKINDFGYTVIYPTIKPNFVSENVGPLVYTHWKKNDQKSDIFNFFHDFYDGQNKSALSSLQLFKNYQMKNKYICNLKNIFKNFIDVGTIDKINKNNRNFFDNIWNISNIKFLKAIVKTPKEYMVSKIFKRFETLPKGAYIINIYRC